MLMLQTRKSSHFPKYLAKNDAQTNFNDIAGKIFNKELLQTKQ